MYVLIGGGLSRVWCVKVVLVDWNGLNYRDWKEGRRESTPLYNTRYIQFIHEQIIIHQPDKYDYKRKEKKEMVKMNKKKKKKKEEILYYRTLHLFPSFPNKLVNDK